MNRSIPRYQALKDGIIEQIACGELQAGDRVPSENELVDAAGVSRMTANRALRELTDEGYVERVHGSGTFVAEPAARSDALVVRNIADEVATRGHAYGAKVLVQEIIEADPRTAAALEIPAGAPVFHARVIHYEEGKPIQLEDRYVVHDFAPDFLDRDFLVETPSAYLTGIAPLQDAEHVLRAEMPPTPVREALQMPTNEPCLVINRRTWADERPVTWARLFHPGARFELTGHYSPVDATGGTKTHSTRRRRP